MKDDKRLKNQEEEKKKGNYPDKNCIKLSLKKGTHPKIENSSEMNIEK